MWLTPKGSGGRRREKEDGIFGNERRLRQKLVTRISMSFIKKILMESIFD